MEILVNRMLKTIHGGWWLNKILKAFIRLCLRSFMRSVFISMLARMCSWQIKEMISLDKSDRRDKPVLLVLSPNRFTRDLDVVSDTGHFNFLLAPLNWQTGLFSLFYPSDQTNHQLAHHRDEPKLKACQENYRAFLAVFLTKLISFRKIDCIIGANYWYHQDIHWGAVAEKLGTPYVVFFKEGFRIQKPDQQLVIKQCERLGGKFEGRFLATQNEVIRNLLLSCNYVDEDNCGSIGVPRMDNFVAKLPAIQKTVLAGAKPLVTLFSFNPGIGLLEKGVAPWPENENQGWGQLFEEVHTTFVGLAVAHPEAEFIIKPKWGGKWLERIAETVSSIGKELSDIPNLKVVLDANAHDLIEKSQVVICFNSTTMLEAGVMKRAVIMPQFDEAIRDDLVEYVKFYGRDDLFELARNQDEMVALISRRLETYEVGDAMQENREREFEKWVSGLSGNATENWCNVIENVLHPDR
jgi:hypothetical protein